MPELTLHPPTTPVTPVVIEMPGIADGKPVFAFPPDAVLEIEHVAAWLRVSERTAEALDINWFYLGTRTRRCFARDVVAFCEQHRAA